MKSKKIGKRGSRMKLLKRNKTDYGEFNINTVKQERLSKKVQ